MKRQLTDAEVNHLRQLLAWMRCEWCLDDDMQRGSLSAVKSLMDSGDITEQQAHQQLSGRAAQINTVPKYVRQAVKMLTKTIREFDGQKGSAVDVEVRDVQELSHG
jgi:hypothetical protein